MSRLLALSILGLWLGATLLLSELRWFRRLPLSERLEPFLPGGLRSRARTGGFANRSFKDVLSPVATSLGGRIARLFGVSEELAMRLQRVGDTTSVAEFRTQQVGWSAAALAATTAVLLALAPPLPLAILVVGATPLIVFLVLEQRLARLSERHQQTVFLELPVVAEQMGMLLSSGFSLSGTLDRVAQRSGGATAADLRRVVARISQGVAPEDALREWARVLDVDEVHQLVTILVLHHDAGDLGSLISQESRSARRENQRRLIERIERRSEQVWIPVTVATLLPGVVFLAIPFVDALGSFGAL